MLKKEQEINGVQIGKGKKKLTLFADDTITYIGNPKESTNSTLQ